MCVTSEPSSGVAPMLLRTCPVLGTINTFKIGLRMPVPSTTPREQIQRSNSSSVFPSSASSPLILQHPSAASSVGTVQVHHFQPTITEPIWPCSPRPWRLGAQGLWGNCCVCTRVCKRVHIYVLICVSLCTDPRIWVWGS